MALRSNIFDRIGGGDKNLADFSQPNASLQQLESQMLRNMQQNQVKGAQRRAQIGTAIMPVAQQGLKYGGGMVKDALPSIFGEAAVQGEIEAGTGLVADAATEGIVGKVGSGLGTGVASSGAGAAADLAAGALGADDYTSARVGDVAKYGTAFAMGGPVGLGVAGLADLADGNIFGVKLWG